MTNVKAILFVTMKTKANKTKTEEDKLYNAYKVLKNESDEDDYCVACDEPLIDIEGLALFTPKGSYRRIFTKNKGETSQRKQRLSTVKISFGNRKIYRQYAAKPAFKLIGGCVGLSPKSWQQLLLKDVADQKVRIEKCSSFWFFWNHPNSATRVSYKLGIIGALLAIISITISIYIQYK